MLGTDDTYKTCSSLVSDLEANVLRCYLQGKSYREMSVELHCRTKCIDNALQRVKRKIGVILEESRAQA